MPSAFRRLSRSLALIVLALALAGLVFQLTGYSIGGVFSAVVQGAVTGPGALGQTIRWTVPLLLVATGAAVSLTAGYFNVGGQGQFYAGAITAYAITFAWPHGPKLIVIVAAIGAGIAAGAVWSLIPGLLRTRWHTDEVLTTLMLNYSGMLLLEYFTVGPYQDVANTSAAAESPVVPSRLRLSGVDSVSPSIIVITAVAFGVVFVLMRFTPFGLTSTLAGRNRTMIRWQGVKLHSVALTAFGISGALAGLAGAIEVLGPTGQLIDGMAPNLGFTALIIVLVGTLRLPGIAAASLLFGGLQAAVVELPVVTGLPASALALLQGIVALVITIEVAPRLLRIPRPQLLRMGRKAGVEEQ